MALTSIQDMHGIVELSISSWFYRNKSIAGFDNPARSLYVAIREIVENSLDACEEAGVLPEISVKLSYDGEGDISDFAAGPSVLRLTIKDNGHGIKRKHITSLIGKMLTGTKFTFRQSRGTFGLGGSLALLYGQVTTQRPIMIKTGRKGSVNWHILKMRLDIERNQPEVLQEHSIEKEPDEHGTTVSFFLEGDWLRSKRKILDYFAQTSIIVPFATLSFTDPEGNQHFFDRVIAKLPATPKTVRPHPKGIDVEMLKSMISVTKERTLKRFLMKSFQRMGEVTVNRFIEYTGLSPDVNPKHLPNQTLVHLMNSFSRFEGFMVPSAKPLSPAGEDVITAGLQRLDPEFVVVTQRAPSVYEGHPFVVEVGIAYGGRIEPGTKVFRFANRIPLLYDEGLDVSSKCLKALNLKSYGLRPDSPLVFFVHLCSTKVPYKTVGKEYLADVDVVRREIDLGMKECLRRISKKVSKRNKVQYKRKRESRLRAYYEFIADVLGHATQRNISLSNLFPEEGE